MAGSSTGFGKDLESYGFRIVSGLGELIVSSDFSAYDARRRKKRTLVLLLGIVLSGIFYTGEIRREKAEFSWHPQISQWAQYYTWAALNLMTLGFSMLWPALPLVLVLRSLYPGQDELRCNEESAQLTHRFLGKARGVRIFPSADVKRIQYVAQTYPWFGPPACLGFLVNGRQVTCLPGLRCIEAKRILEELKRMGFDVISNPDMPVMIQMEAGGRGGWPGCRG